MTWTALIPLKPDEQRKQRLGDRLSPAARLALSQQMFDHVTSVLRATPGISALCLLSHAPVKGWTDGWIADRGRGLNVELNLARTALGRGPLLVIHADLPLLRGADVQRLLTSAEEEGMAIAPDRHALGTNAIAIADGRMFNFDFEKDSLQRHRDQAGPACALISRTGLAFDIDMPDDLDAALAQGFTLA